MRMGGWIYDGVRIFGKETKEDLRPRTYTSIGWLGRISCDSFVVDAGNGSVGSEGAVTRCMW